MRSRIFFCLFLIFCLSAAANAQFTSRIGNGASYRCLSNYTSTSIESTFGKIQRVNDGMIVSQSRALNRIATRIRVLQDRVRSGGSAGLRRALKNLRASRTDIRRCVNYGTTEKDFTGGFSRGDICALVGAGEARARSTENPVASPIVGGHRCDINSAGVVPLALYVGDTYVGDCSGTVVRRPSQYNSSVVIFAAHCVEGGVDQVEAVLPSGSMFSAFVTAHPNWNSNNDDFAKADVALALFDEVIPTQSFIIHPFNDFSDGEIGIIAGYGLDEYEYASFDRLKVGLMKISEVNTHHIGMRYLGPGANTCSGDSGGPIFVNREGQWLVAGATSYGLRTNCDAGDYSYFSNFSDPAVISWLNSVVPGLVG